MRTISYPGCGCAGGQVETICDEGDGVLVNGQPRKRQQKVYHDVAGRVTKTQVLNWDSSIYATTVNTYNERDQLTCVKEYVGNATGAEACPSATCQKTDLSYDGHGRLYQRKLPIENAAMTYSYFADDTVQTITDARGASVTYGYNNRQLATSLTYGVPGGVAATPGVTFGYDAAGNRTWMDDGPGRVDYTYNTLSQMQTETRTFDGVAGTYMLSYTYNLPGQVKTVTDNRFNTAQTYNYDKAGQLTCLSGTGYVGSGQTDFISTTLPITYRAWGAVKQFVYGNNVQTSYNYNIRLQTSSYTRTQPAGYTQTIDYLYYPDARAKSALDHSVTDSFDRSYAYDHAGRISEARTAGEARGSTGEGAYRQRYTYDPFNNLSGRDNHFWGHTQPVDTTTYTNDRRAGWIYDNAGNVLTENGQSHSYDAASRDVLVTGGGYVGVPPVPVWEIAQTPNGDGQPVKRIETRRAQNGTPTVTTTYYVRSSVLGGEKLIELDALGNKLRSYVYGAGTRLAKHELLQGSWHVRWCVGKPVTSDWGETLSNGNFVDSTFLDPLGAEIPPNDPYILDPTPTYIEQKANEPLYIDGGDPFDLSGGCTLDGVPVPCDFVAPLANSDVAVRAPVQTTRFRNGHYKFCLYGLML